MKSSRLVAFSALLMSFPACSGKTSTNEVAAVGGSSGVGTSASSVAGAPATGGTHSTSTATGGAHVTGGSPAVAGSGAVGGTSTGGTSGPSTNTCVGTAVTANLPGLNILFLVDKSGSMGDNPNGSWANAATRWNPVVTAIDTFIKDVNSTGIYTSLSVMPADGNLTMACSASSYSSGSASIKLPLTQLDDTGRQSFLSLLCDPAAAQAATCIVPAGGTLARSAVQGILDYAASARTTNPNRSTIVIFITDGEPGFGYYDGSAVNALYSCDDISNGCLTDTSLCTTADAEIQKVASVIKTAPARSVYLFGAGDLSASTTNIWAAASGNPAITLQGMTGAQSVSTMSAALNSIRSAHRSCSFAIPSPTSGGAIDYTKLNVDYVDGANTAQLGRSDNCTSASPSWHYDSPTTPTQIVICPNACAPAQQSATGTFQFIFGCSGPIL